MLPCAEDRPRPDEAYQTDLSAINGIQENLTVNNSRVKKQVYLVLSLSYEDMVTNSFGSILMWLIFQLSGLLKGEELFTTSAMQSLP